MRQLILAVLLLLLSASTLPAQTVTGSILVDPESFAGADANDRALLYAPDPLEPGSSISHFDNSAFPNLLMEPAINGSLTVDQIDLTLFQFRDIGWPNGTANITLRNMDPAGQGFNDPTLGAQRLAAVERAAQIWANRLGSSVEINVDISFEELDCGNDGAVLAQAGARFLFESFPGAPLSGVWYHGALAESLSGENLSLEDVANPDAGDLALTFNDQIDNACLGAGSRFYYGLDANEPGGQISFVHVAMHEMAHGLGFGNFANESTGALFLGQNDIYTNFIFDNTQGRFWRQMNNNERRVSAINTGNVVWTGNRVTSQVPNFLDPAPRLVVDAPAAIAGKYVVGRANFGPVLTQQGITGELVQAIDGSALPTLLCEPAVNGSELAGKIAVVDRGECNFTVKVRNAQDVGAVAVVVVNNVVAGGALVLGGNDPLVNIPAVSLSMSDGALIKEALADTGNPGNVRFNNTSFSAGEADGTAILRVRRQGGSDGVLTVDYATVDGTATAGEDYEMANGTVTFADGEDGLKIFEITLLDDAVVEGDEILQVQLSNVTGGTLNNPTTAELTIEDDDESPNGSVAFSTDTYSVGEGDGFVMVTVTRSGGTLGAVSVDVATGGGDATAGQDYTSTAMTLTFADGESGSMSFNVPILDDSDEEGIESFGLALSNVTGGAVLGTPSSTTVRITDNEACQESDTQLCLNGGRFRTSISWRDGAGNAGSGTVVTSSDDSGLFWFFAAPNWEMMVKVLNGCRFTDHFWVFAAATTDVEYTLQVTDTLTGDTKEYFNPLGTSAAAITDTLAFATCDAGAQAPVDNADNTVAKPAPAPVRTSLISEKMDCQGTATTLCLNEQRFQVEVEWRDAAGNTGVGTEVVKSDDSGVVWFFAETNWEMLIKVLDGCGINDNYWVFAAATTDVEYTLRVTDTNNGTVQEYFNPLGNAAAAITDTGAFPTCP